MKSFKKYLFVLFIMFLITLILSSCKGCGNKNHEHVFDQEIADAKYLKATASCEAKAVYYKSCACGVKGEDTFTYGEFGNHTFSDEWTSDENKHYHTASCSHTDQISDEAPHTWNEGEITIPATTEKEGEMTYTCTVCKRTKKEIIEKLDILSIELKSVPLKTSYELYEEYDFTGLEIIANCKNGTKAILQESDYVIDTTDMDNATEPGKYGIVVSLKKNNLYFCKFYFTQNEYKLSEGKYAIIETWVSDKYNSVDVAYPIYNVNDGKLIYTYPGTDEDTTFKSISKTTYKEQKAVLETYSAKTRTFGIMQTSNEIIFCWNLNDLSNLSKVVKLDENDYNISIMVYNPVTLENETAWYSYYAIDGFLPAEFFYIMEEYDLVYYSTKPNDVDSILMQDTTFTSDTSIYQIDRNSSKFGDFTGIYKLNEDGSFAIVTNDFVIFQDKDRTTESKSEYTIRPNDAKDGYIGYLFQENGGPYLKMDISNKGTMVFERLSDCTLYTYVKMTGISVKTPPIKNTYSEGESLDYTGLVIEAKYQDGTSEVLSSSFLTFDTSAFDNANVTGNYDIIIKLNVKTSISCKITVTKTV